MRLPIKLNQRGFPPWVTGRLPSRDDPRRLQSDYAVLGDFESAITAIKVGSTWKSTSRNRHVLSDAMILDALVGTHNPQILEIGVSSGSSSLDLLERLGGRIGKYWSTDLFFHIRTMRKENATYFFHPLTQRCILRVSDRLLVYAETGDALPLFGWIATLLIARAPSFDADSSQEVSLIHPVLRKRAAEDVRVVICEHDVFQEWRKEKVHLVKVANVLNRLYFSDDMIKTAIAEMKRALRPKGHLVIVDNRKVERASLFGLNNVGTFELRAEVNGGCEIGDLVR